MSTPMTPQQLSDYATTVILERARDVDIVSIIEMADEHTDAGQISEDDARRVQELIETADITVDILILTTGPAPDTEDPAPREPRVWQAGDDAVWHDEDGEPRTVKVLRTPGPIVVKHGDSGAVTSVDPSELSEVPARGDR